MYLNFFPLQNSGLIVGGLGTPIRIAHPPIPRGKEEVDVVVVVAVDVEVVILVAVVVVMVVAMLATRLLCNFFKVLLLSCLSCQFVFIKRPVINMPFSLL